jgi:hypothetical protein
VVPFAVRRCPFQQSSGFSIGREGFGQGRLVQTVVVEPVGWNVMMDEGSVQGRLLRILRVGVDTSGRQTFD